jgi:tuftelin-interacting protein 11
MKAAFPLSIYGHILTEVVAPRLKMEVNTWAPTKDTVPVHKWIHPWLDVLPQDSLEQIFVLLRTKLGAALRAWQPLDGSALLLISAWKGVWSRPDMWDFLSRYILPKLRHLSSKMLNVNPTNEDIKPFQALVNWHEVVPTHALASMLLTDFFPKWFRALTSWLSADSADSKAKFEEIARWYKGWRGMFPDTLLSHPVVEAQLRRALDLMNAAVSGNSLDSVLQQLAAAFPAQQEALRKEAAKAGEGGVGVDSRTKAQQQSGANRLRAQTAAAKAGAGGVSFKEAIERFAARNGLEFVPNVRKGLRDGCQVYTFGRCNIYLKGQVVYAHVPAKGGGGQWRPVAIDELITMAR